MKSVVFKWISKDGLKFAYVAVEAEIDSLDNICDRQKAYDALAKIIGEDNIEHCVIA